MERKSYPLMMMNREGLAVLKHRFNLVVSADYQMSKLVPYWGMSAQPGSMYYLQKLSHDILEVVNHATNYLFDERVGPKNTDHTVSYITHFIGTLPQWIQRSLITRVARTRTFMPCLGLAKWFSRERLIT